MKQMNVALNYEFIYEFTELMNSYTYEFIER
jgi:hypothetical protein